MRRAVVLTMMIAAGPAFADGPAAGGQSATMGAPSSVEAGHAVYKRFCAQCHGPEMVNPGTSSYDLRKFPADAHDRFITSVTNGKNQQMPAWGGALSNEEMEAVWSYVRARGNS